MTLLHFLGYASLFFSIVALMVVIYHWNFFNRVQKSELGKRMMLVFLSDIVMYASIGLYGLNWVMNDGGVEWRLFLKSFQIFGIIFNLYALTALLKYYKKIV